MDIRAQYVIQKKLSYYQAPKFYEDTKGIQEIRRSKINTNSKKLSVFDEIIKVHSKVPGPGKYTINPEDTKKNKYKINRSPQQNKKPRQTYLDPLLKRSMSLPAVGKYNIDKYSKISTDNKYIHQQKNISTFRPTVFDIFNKDQMGVSPGIYEIKSTIMQSPRYSIPPESKKPKSLPKIPGPQDYTPVPSSFSTFQRRSMVIDSDSQIKNCTFGARIEQKNKQKSPGPIYNLITSWGSKKQMTNQFSLYKSISSAPKQSIYNSKY